MHTRNSVIHLAAAVFLSAGLLLTYAVTYESPIQNLSHGHADSDSRARVKAVRKFMLGSP